MNAMYKMFFVERHCIAMLLFVCLNHRRCILHAMKTLRCILTNWVIVWFR